MKKHRIFLETFKTTTAHLPLDSDTFHYLSRVRRCREGDELTVISSNSLFTGMLSKVTKASLSVVSWQQSPLPKVVFPDITLIQCLPKGDKISEVLKSATEFGVSRIIPVHSERSEFKTIGKDEKLHSRWQAILQNSAQQSFRYAIPALDPIQSLSDAVSTITDDAIKLVCWEEEPGNELTARIKNGAYTRDNRFVFIIGPEGGLSFEEVDRLKTAGFNSVSLGPYVYRTEHAAFGACNQLIAALPGNH